MPWMTRRQVRSQPVQSYAERELQKLLKSYENRMQRLNDEYLRRMGEHIAKIGTLWPSDIHRLQQIRRMNQNLRAIERRIAEAAKVAEKEIEALFIRIAEEDARMATKILGVPDIMSVRDNLPLMRLIEAQARETAGRMANLSNTTVVSDFYRKAVDEAVSSVQSGVEDYGSAIRRVIREAGAHGLRVREDGTTVVDYESGHSRRLDSAARMNVLDGVRHLNQSVMEEVGRQFGADGVEIDAHMLCAEDHLPYQGQQYSNEEFEQIQDSLDRPFGEWNCRHMWHGIILGVSPPLYTPEQLEEMRLNSMEEITIDGRTKTRYQWSQEMRRCETRVRQLKDTSKLAEATGDTSLRRNCQGQITELNKYYRELANKAGIGTEYQRTYVAGFRDFRGARTLTGNGKSGTMGTEARPMANGLRSQPRDLTPEEIESVKESIRRIGADESVFLFNSGARTSYDDDIDRIYIKGDVFPDMDSSVAADRMSVEAVLAHEYYGHRTNRGTSLPMGDWRDELRASMTASVYGQGLTVEDRQLLMRDALDRAALGGVTLNITPTIRRVLYGY